MSLDALPTDRPVIAWYGDDFTGSGAVMEVLTFAGLPAVLFLEPPTPAMLARFPDARAIGLAGDARTRTSDWMRTELPAAFAALRALQAPILHYKVCSTLDSAPAVGSIGAAAEVALAPGELAPMLVAAPEIGRWQAFGTLFARAGDGIYRLDRHPTMAVHPVTPMTEADVRRHLSAQTGLRVGLIDLVELKAGRGPSRFAEERTAGGGIVAIDVVDDETLAAAGALIWQAAPGFVIGSQGVEYALVAAWKAAGLLAPPPDAGPLEFSRAHRRGLRLMLANHRRADRPGGGRWLRDRRSRPVRRRMGIRSRSRRRRRPRRARARPLPSRRDRPWPGRSHRGRRRACRRRARLRA